MAKLWQKKAVLVSVYEEKPTKRKLPSNNHHHHHHHHRHYYYVHHSIKQDNKHGETAVKGYNRRAELLLYSQHLRQSVRSAESPQLNSKPISSNIQQPTGNAVAVQRKEEDNRSTPSCLGTWKVLKLKFCRSLVSVQIKKGTKKKNTGSARNVTKAFMKNIELQKKKGFISKLLQKHR
ncbi:lysine-specific demethylase 7B-like [Jatropha curcas]|uniref:lysine-specific demethylase 7B-like n=1 Tax=Jatropha curcas TaxID=180498 RepID=UPI0009D6EFFA|nr:lysine-specific demethylase 7B-like [Jatropha curcas]